MKNKLVCFTFSGNSIHIAAALEIILSKNLNYDELHFYWLGGKTLYPSRMARNLELVNSRFHKSFFPRIFEKFENINYTYNDKLNYSPSDLNELLHKFKFQLNSCEILEDLYSLNVENIHPGAAIVNTLVAELQRDKIQVNKYLRIIHILLLSYLQIYLTVKNQIKKNPKSDYLIYNGRFLHERAVWDAAIKLKKKVFIYETIRDRYILRNFGFHDRKLNQKEMRKLWENSKIKKSEKEKLASRYFLDLYSKQNKFYTSKSLPSSLQGNKNVVFFTNTDFEAIGFWNTWRKPSHTQVEVVKFMSSYLASRDDLNFVVRLHPNMKKQGKLQKKQWSFLKENKNIVVIDEDSKISSVELIKNSIAVFSFGSTVGLEAAYYGTPSFVLADCWYDELGAAKKINNLQELLKILTGLPESSLDVRKAKTGALIRGFWFSNSGVHFQNSKLIEKNWGEWEAKEFLNTPITLKTIWLYASKLQNGIKRIRLGLKP